MRLWSDRFCSVCQMYFVLFFRSNNNHIGISYTINVPSWIACLVCWTNCKLGQNKMRNKTTPSPNSMMYLRYNENAPFFSIIEMGGGVVFFIHFVQDCRFIEYFLLVHYLATRSLKFVSLRDAFNIKNMYSKQDDRIAGQYHSENWAETDILWTVEF